MAQKRKYSKKKKGITLKLLLVFIFFITVAFFVLYNSIPSYPEADASEQAENETLPPVTQPPVTQPPVTQPPVTQPPVTQPPVTQPPVTQPPVTQPPVTQPPVTQPPVTQPPVTQPPVTQPPVTQPPVTQPPVTQPPAVPPPETRDRAIYLIRDETGSSVLTRVNRKIEVSASPLADCINTLLKGPTDEERNRGIRSSIPANTRLLSARMQGNVAHLNFSKEFANAIGRAAQAALVEQIVFTATEFNTVNSVQFLIEGKEEDFLSEGISIRGPIGR